MNYLQIHFQNEITLKSSFTKKYLGYKSQSQNMTATFPPPSINRNQISNELVDTALKFKIKVVGKQQILQNQKNNALLDGSKIYLLNAATQQFLTCTSKGALKFDKMSANQEMTKNLLKQAVWTVVLASAQKSLIAPSKMPLGPFDVVIIKSHIGTHLTVQNLSFICDSVLQMDQQRSLWTIERASWNQLPAWMFQKQSFSKYMKKGSIQGMVSQKRNLRTHTPEIQQAYLVEDLIDISLGYEGVYIKKRPQTNYYAIEPHLQAPSCNVALAQLSHRILQLSTHYQKIMKFICELEIKESILAQALSDGLRKIVSQYYYEVIELDERVEQGLGLQSMWVEVQDSLKILRGISDLVNSAAGLTGGQLLTCLFRIINQNSDFQILKIYKHIFQNLIMLYAQILAKWIYEGVIEDKYNEFMIKADQKLEKEWTNWQQRYSLRTEQIPSLFERDKQKILVTGKYLNILKACNKQIKCPLRNELKTNISYHIDRQTFTQPIESAYSWANQQLLNMVFKQCKFLQVLKSLKGYYFLNFGDLFVHFLDSAEQDLNNQKKTMTDSKTKPFSIQKIQNLFDVNVRISSSANDPYKDDVNCILDANNIFQQMNRIKTLDREQFQFDFSEKPYVKRDSRYIDYISLDFKCGFPLNLLLNKKNIAKYQSMFRLMIWCKFLERQLGSCWLKLQCTKQIGLDCFKNIYILNHKILNFVKSMVYYLSQQVVEQNWERMINGLKKVKNFEQIIKCHDTFLNSCLKQSLLSNSHLLSILISDIGGAIKNYASIRMYLQKIQQSRNQIKSSYPRPKNIVEARQLEQIIKDRVYELLQQHTYQQFLQKSHATFNQVLSKFKRQIILNTKREQSHLVRLTEMLDVELAKKSSLIYH